MVFEEVSVGLGFCSEAIRMTMERAGLESWLEFCEVENGCSCLAIIGNGDFSFGRDGC